MGRPFPFGNVLPKWLGMLFPLGNALPKWLGTLFPLGNALPKWLGAHYFVEIARPVCFCVAAWARAWQFLAIFECPLPISGFGTLKKTVAMKNFILGAGLLVLWSCAEPQIKVACVGDSITEGAGLAVQSQTGYPVVLQKVLGQTYSVLNSGRSATTLQKKGDFPYWIAKEFSNVFAFKPQIVVIKLGTNDTKPYNWNAERFAADYCALIDTLKSISPAPRIILCKPVPVYETRWGINDSTLVHGVIPAIEALAQEQKLEVVDLYSALSNHGEMFPDQIHPNEAGAALMAETIAQTILNP